MSTDRTSPNPSRFTDAFDPIILTPPRAAGRLTSAALLITGAALLLFLLTPILGLLWALPLAFIGFVFAVIDLAHALITRRDNWPWSLGAVAINLGVFAAVAAILAVIFGTMD